MSYMGIDKYKNYAGQRNHGCGSNGKEENE
jgi:hypothetical protein